MKNNLDKEIEKNFKLIKYDRNKILSEQDESFISGINKWVDDYIRKPVMSKVDDANEWLDDNFRDPVNEKVRALNDKVQDYVQDIADNPRKLLGMSQGDVKWLYDRFVHPVKAVFTMGYLQTEEGRKMYPDLSAIDRAFSNRVKEMNQWMRSDDSIVPSILLNLGYLASRANPYAFAVVTVYDILEINAYMEPTEENPNGDWFMGGILAFMALTNIADFAKMGGFSPAEVRELREYAESLGKTGVKESTQTKWQKFLKDPLMAKKVNKILFSKALKEFITKRFPRGIKQIAQFIIWMVSKGYLLSSFLLRIAITLVGAVIKSVLGIALFAIPWYVVCRILKLPGAPSFDSMPPIEKLMVDQKNQKLEDNQIPLIATINTISTYLLKTKKVFSPSENYEVEVELFQQFFEKVYPTEPDYLDTTPRYVYNGKSKKINFYNLNNIKTINIFNITGKKLVVQNVSETNELSFYISKLNSIYLSGLLLIELKTKDNKNYISKFFPQFDSQNTFFTQGQEYEIGIYNKNFESTVISFQKKNNLSVDGRLGSNTLNKIIEICNSKKEIFIKDESGIVDKLRKKYDNLLETMQKNDEKKIKENEEKLRKLLAETEMNEKERQRTQDSIANSYVVPEVTDQDFQRGIDYLDSLINN